MGVTNTKDVSSSDMSSSDYESEDDIENIETIEDLEPNTIDSVSPNEETDAALRKTVSLPTAENVLNLDIINTIEDELDDQEIVSLVYLVSENKNIHWFVQQLILLNRGGNRKILSQWAVNDSKKETNWQNKLIEALCIIKNFQILKLLGYDKSDVTDHFLPNNLHSLHINKFRKCAYLICDNFGPEEMEVFLNHVKENFEKRNITFEKINTDYLEIYFLTWERDKHLEISELKSILKIMNEERLYDLFDTALPQVPKENVNDRLENDIERPSTSFQLPQNDREKPSTSFEIPDKRQSLKDAWRIQDISRTRKPSSGTSIDNNAPRSETPHESNFLEFQYFQDNIKKLDTNNVYPVDPENPGIVLIINQEHFYTEFDPQYKLLLPPKENGKLVDRKGSENDRERLRDIFEKFGFKVVVKESIPHLEMIQAIKDVTNQVTKQQSSLFICIMSHGDQGIVYGSNSCYIKVSEIQEIMSTYNKENLLGKPKLLILQSCQGKECQILETDSTAEEHFNITTDGPSPDHRDMFTFWATIRGYAAIRNKQTGSWFIQALCDEINEYGEIEHFADICTRVKLKVTEQRWIKTQKEKIGMTPIVETTLAKKFFFPERKRMY